MVIRAARKSPNVSAVAPAFDCGACSTMCREGLQQSTKAGLEAATSKTWRTTPFGGSRGDWSTGLASQGTGSYQ